MGKALNFKTKVASISDFPALTCQNTFKMQNNPRQLGIYSSVFAHLYVILGEGTGRHVKNAEGNLFYLFLVIFNLLFKKRFSLTWKLTM